MSQKGLEEIFAQYAQAIESSQTLSPVSPVEDEFWTDEVEWDDETSEESLSKRNSLFSQPNETLKTPEESASPKEGNSAHDHEPPLNSSQSNALLTPSTPDEKPRKMSANPFRNRLSWGSELGTSSSPSQHLASELMSLFDMEFKVDIHINTAPKLPELPFKSSQDPPKGFASDRHSIMSLVSELESFSVEDLDVRSSSPFVSFPPPPRIPPPEDRRTARRSSSLASNANSSWTTRKPIDSTIPKRSSSLSVASSPRINSQMLEKAPYLPNSEDSKRATVHTSPNSFKTVTGHHSSASDDPLAQQNKKLKKKSSFRQLADLVTMKKSSSSPYSNSQQSKSAVSSSWVSLPDMGSDTDLKSSHSSSQASVVTIQPEIKPLPASPVSPIHQSSATAGDSEYQSSRSGGQTPVRSSSLRHKHSKKRRSVMEPTAKRANTAPAGLVYEGATVPDSVSQGTRPTRSNVIPIGSTKHKKDKTRKDGYYEPNRATGRIGSSDEQDHSNHRNSILAHRRSLTPAGLDLADGIPVEDPGFVTIGKGIGNFGGAASHHKESNANATGKFIKRMVSLGRAMRVRNSVIV